SARRPRRVAWSLDPGWCSGSPPYDGLAGDLRLRVSAGLRPASPDRVGFVCAHDLTRVPTRVVPLDLHQERLDEPSRRQTVEPGHEIVRGHAHASGEALGRRHTRKGSFEDVRQTKDQPGDQRRNRSQAESGEKCPRRLVHDYPRRVPFAAGERPHGDDRRDDRQPEGGELRPPPDRAQAEGDRQGDGGPDGAGTGVGSSEPAQDESRSEERREDTSHAGESRVLPFREGGSWIIGSTASPAPEIRLCPQTVRGWRSPSPPSTREKMPTGARYGWRRPATPGASRPGSPTSGRAGRRTGRASLSGGGRTGRPRWR